MARPRLLPLLLLLLPALGLGSACPGPRSVVRRAPPPVVEPGLDEDMRLEEDPPPDRRRADTLVEKGRDLRESGDHAGAAERFAAARTEDETHGIAHLEWAISAQYVGAAPDEVRRAFTRATALLEENPRAYYERAAFEESAGELSAALELYRRALALRPDHAKARQAYARALATSGDHSGAVAQYRRLARNEPRNLAAQLGLATAAEKTGDLATAEKALRHVVKLHPKVGAHRRRLIAFYERTDQPKKAHKEERRLDRVDPDKKRRMRALKPSRRR
jgi:tetratricopeptide (TPR) repeat protein